MSMRSRLLTFLGFALLLALYVFFWSNHYSTDGWAYAEGARYGRELFQPHHLLYTVTGYLAKRLATSFITDDGDLTLHVLLLLNSLAAWLSVIVLYRILLLLQPDPVKALLLSLVAGLSYGCWRYATDIEVYILPLLFSLLSSLYFLHYYIRQKLPVYLLISGIMGALACLYHQIHIFWWMGLLAGVGILSRQRRWRDVLVYALPFVIVPLCYILVLILYVHQPLSVSALMHFVLHDVYAGEAGGWPKGNVPLLSAVSLFRSFLQLHGMIAVMFKSSLAYKFAISTAALLVLAAVLMLAVRLLRCGVHIKPGYRIYFRLFLSIFIVQWLFAAYNAGNAEFMVMLPALLVMMAACMPEVSVRVSLVCVVAIFCWNMTAGAYINHYARNETDTRVAAFIADYGKNNILVASNRALIENYLRYKGQDSVVDRLLPSPSMYALRHGGQTAGLKQHIDSLLNAGTRVWTDCVSSGIVVSRASMLYHQQDVDFFKQYCLPAFLCGNGDPNSQYIKYGERVIAQVEPKGFPLCRP